MPAAHESVRRWFRPERPGWKSVASSTAPIRSAGCSIWAYGFSKISASPWDGFASPSSMRRVVVLPAPFGPRNPVIVPGSSANERLSTAVSLPNRFVSDSARTTGAMASG